MSNNRILVLGSGALGIEIWTLGARLNNVWIDGEGGLLARSDTLEEALGEKKNHGAVVGPVANRLAHAEAPVGDKVFQLAANENGRTICHSGTKGVNLKQWSVDTANSDEVLLSLAIADGEDDFPGNRQLTARYRMAEDGFDVEFGATTDADTLMNLALHPYWALNRTGRKGQKIRINADAYLPIDADKIPTGKVASVSASQFDLREIQTPSRDIDHNFCLNSGSPATEITADNGIVLSIATDAPGMQIYTGNPVGIAIEPQHWPDAPHHPDFPSILLKPGQAYRQTSTYRFSRA